MLKDAPGNEMMLFQPIFNISPQRLNTASDRHGYGIPGGYTDTGTTGTDTDSPFGTRGCTRTRIHGTHTRHGGFLVVLQQLTSNIIY